VPWSGWSGLYQEWEHKTHSSTRAANLVLRVVLGQAHLLGLAPREIKVEHSEAVEHDHVQVPAEPVADVLARLLERNGRPVPAQLTRLDLGDHGV
jgi:hypothetical protein